MNFIMHLSEKFPIQSVFDYYFANKLLLLSLLSLCLLRQGITLRSLPTNKLCAKDKKGKPWLSHSCNTKNPQGLLPPVSPNTTKKTQTWNSFKTNARDKVLAGPGSKGGHGSVTSSAKKTVTFAYT